MSDGRPAVLVCRELPPAGRLLLEERCAVRVGGLDATPAGMRELAAGCEALVADPTVPVDEALLDAAGPGLRVVANFAVGFDNVDVQACVRRDIAVTNTPDVLTNATAELALALTLAAARGLWDAGQDLRDGGWRGWEPAGYLGHELSRATFAIVGLGRIGTRYAELVRPLAGELLYVSPSPRPAVARPLGARRVELAEALERAAVLSIHAPARPETHHLIGAQELSAMRADAVLVNTARGSLVDSAALATALSAGELGGAGLDVYEDEPRVPPELLRAPRCVLMPHIGSATHRARDAMARTAAVNALAALAGEEPPNRVA